MMSKTESDRIARERVEALLEGVNDVESIAYYYNKKREEFYVTRKYIDNAMAYQLGIRLREATMALNRELKTYEFSW